MGGLQIGYGLKNGIGFMVNLGSNVLSQAEHGKGAENYNTDGNPIIQQELSISAIVGGGIKRTFQTGNRIGSFDGMYQWEKIEISIGLLGVFNASWEFDGNWNLQQSFKGVELKLEGAAVFGGNWTILKNGWITEY